MHTHAYPQDDADPHRATAAAAAADGNRRGTNGVSTNGVSLRIPCFFDTGTFWVPPLACFLLPKSARAYISFQICQN